MNSSNPIIKAHWKALKRESILIRQLLGSGATALGKASYADGLGKYYEAFFGLSIGLERFGKLIIVTNHAIENSGKLPTAGEIIKYGHNIKNIFNTVDGIVQKRQMTLKYTRPSDDISDSIIDCLDSFADARRGRYGNFQELGDPNFDEEFEPISQWWKSVAEKIMQKHLAGTKKEIKIHTNAADVAKLMAGIALVRFQSETGDSINDAGAASIHSGQTELVQQWGRIYSLRMVRWLSCIFEQLSSDACYKHGIDIFFGHSEFFDTYRVGDDFLKTRKNWPLN